MYSRSTRRRGAKEVTFDREEIVDAAQELGLPRPKNVGDVVYWFRFRKAFQIQSRKLRRKVLMDFTKGGFESLSLCFVEAMVR